MRLATLPESELQAETFDLRVLDSVDSPADPAALARLRDGVADVDLAAPPVALPDFHLKGDKEMPSSIAVATTDTIRPTLTSASVNCGMTLIATDLPRPDVDAVTDFYRRVRERYPYPTTYRRDLTAEEVVRCAAEGGDYAVARFDVDPNELERVEERGRLDVERYGGLDRVRRELPWSVLQLSRIRFGTIGPSNHFAELQEVEEILDGQAAELLGVGLGQITLQFHGGGGSLPGELGMLFGRRKRYPRPVRIQMAVQKPLYHLGRARSIAELRLRRALYFSDGYPPVERDSAEGERLLLANAMAMNYGFAFRLSTYASLQALFRQTFGPTDSRIVVDSPHNSIYEEEINGESALVHRHNAARAYPASRLPEHPIFSQIGQPLLLPGTNRTSSYLCVAAEEAAAGLYSASHGAGSNVKTFVQRGLSKADPKGRTTLHFNYSRAEPTEVPQLDDRGVDDVIQVLTRHGVVRPVARLRPFAVLN
jgi:tRNA-splicing ligase RtcB (3'-phosphate/5'-hydroxy nucleic acid ligase)